MTSHTAPRFSLFLRRQLSAREVVHPKMDGTRRGSYSSQKGAVAPGRATVPQCRSGSGDTARRVRVLRACASR